MPHDDPPGTPATATAPPPPLGAATPPPRSLTEQASEGSPDFWRNFGKWTVGFFFFIALLALLVVLPLFQVTSEGPAKKTLRRATGALTEIDPLIARNYDDLQQRAAALRPGETVQVNDYPIAIPLTREEALGSSKAQIRELLLSRSADLMYRDGTAPLRASTGNRQHIGFFTIGGLTDQGLGFLRSRNHDILAALTFALAALCAVLGVTLAVLCRGFGRLASVGAAVLLAAIPFVVGGIAARFYMRIASSDDKGYIQREFLQIGQALAWIPIRDGLAFVVLGAAFFTVGFLGARWTDRRPDPRFAPERGYAR